MRQYYRAPGADTTGLQHLDIPKWDQFTREAHKALGPMFDLENWGYWDGRICKPRYRYSNEVMDRYYRRALDKGEWFELLTKPRLHMHFLGWNKLYAVPNRKGWPVLLAVDADAHNGEPDATAAAIWAVNRYFPGSYDEPSERGHHAYVLVERGNYDCGGFNALLESVHRSLGALAKSQGFSAPLEFKGRFTLLDDRQIVTRGGMVPLPRFPNRYRDLDRLMGAPIFGADVLEQIVTDAKPLMAEEAPVPKPLITLPSPTYVCVPKIRGTDAFRLKLDLAKELEHRLRRPPTEGELTAAYREVNPKPESRDRTKEIRDVVKYFTRTFDPAKLPKQNEGWAQRRAPLVKAVAEHCGDDLYIGKLEKWKGKISAEELAVAVFVVEANSFAKRGDVQFQWTNAYGAFIEMYRKLKADGVYKGGIPNRNKVSAIKRALVAARLIECFDSSYRPGTGGKRGIAMKYHVGPAHPRWREFLVFAETVKIKKTRDVDGWDEPSERSPAGAPVPSPVVCGESAGDDAGSLEDFEL